MNRTARFRIFAPRAGTLVSTGLLIAAFPPFDWSPVVGFALVPWLLVLRKSSRLVDVLIQAMHLQVLVGLGWGHWLPSAVSEFLGVSTSTGLAALILNSTFHQLHLIPFAAIVYRFAGRPHPPLTGAVLLALALSYCGLDWLMPSIFQHEIGGALHHSRELSQIVELAGVPGLTLLVLISNLTIFAVIETVRGSAGWAGLREGRLLATTLASGLVWGAAWGFGNLRADAIDLAIDQTKRNVRVGVVQGSVSNEVKRAWREGNEKASREALGVYVRSTKSLAERAGNLDLFIWPETAYPGIYRRPENEDQADLNVSFDQFIGALGVPIIFGAYDREDRTDRRVLRNGMFFVEPRPGQLRSELSESRVYHKSTLFPIGETLPLLSGGSRRRWFPAAPTFSTGTGPRVFPLQLRGQDDPIRVGPSICYEDLFPDHFIALARSNANLFVNISNDSWFGDSGEPRLHLIYARFRSIESRRAQIRVTNSGYSALILPSGGVRYESEYGDRIAAVYSVPIIGSTETLLMRWGSWFGPTSFGAAFVGLGMIEFRRRSLAPGHIRPNSVHRH